MTKNPTYRDLAADEREALQKFADHYGKHWKSDLSWHWNHDTSLPPHTTDDDAAALRRIRNTLGAGWLYGHCTIKSRGGREGR